MRIGKAVTGEEFYGISAVSYLIFYVLLFNIQSLANTLHQISS